MNNRKALLLPALALAIGIMHLAAIRLPDCFGFDALRYFSRAAAAIWALLFLALAGAIVRIPLERLPPKLDSKYLPAMIGLCWLFMLLFLRASAPLLGDGLARVQGIRAAYLSELKSQPAILDAVIHFLLFQFLQGLPRADFLTYTLLSYLAGLFYLSMVFIAGRRFFSDPREKVFWLLIMLGPGYIQLFAGYAENYSFLPGLVLLWMIGIKEAERGKVWPLIASQMLLISFHLFFLLTLPATLYLLVMRPEKRIRFAAMCLTLLGAGAGAVSLVLVWKYFRGLDIFLRPDRFFAPAHFRDLFNNQMAASPAFPLLFAGLFLAREKAKPSRPEIALLLAVLIVAVFFFFLRPAIGAARDWDLFCFPAMLYTPALALYLLPRLKDAPNLAARFGAFIFLVSAFHTGAWLSVNHYEPKMIRRIEFHLDENRGRERWASAYGYMVLGKYYVLTDRLDPAMNAFDKSIKIDPSYSQFRLLYGYQLWRVGKYEDAIAQMEKARAINPTSPGIRKFLSHFYLEYARILMAAGRNLEAETCLQKLFELDPAWRPGLETLADFYRNYLKDPGKARYYEGLLNQK